MTGFKPTHEHLLTKYRCEIYSSGAISRHRVGELQSDLFAYSRFNGCACGSAYVRDERQEPLCTFPLYEAGCPSCVPDEWRKIEEMACWWIKYEREGVDRNGIRYEAHKWIRGNRVINDDFASQFEEMRSPLWGKKLEGERFHFGTEPPNASGSSNGRTSDFESENVGSIPAPETIITIDPFRDYRHLVGCQFQAYPNNKHCSCHRAVSLCEGEGDRFATPSEQNDSDAGTDSGYPVIQRQSLGFDCDYDENYPDRSQMGLRSLRRR